MSALYFYDFNPSILLLHEKLDAVKVLAYSLRKSGFMVYVADSIKDGLELYTNKHPHMVVSSSVLKDGSCFDMHEQILSLPHGAQVPFVCLLLSASNEDVKLTEKSSNYFEFIDASLSPSEVVSKIKMLYKRSQSNMPSTIIEYGDIVMNLASFKVTKAGREIHLGPTEFKILQCFIENPQTVFSREYFIQTVWDNKPNVEPRTVDVYVNRLRTALTLSKNEPSPIETIRSQGYCLRQQQVNAIAVNE